MHWLTHSVNRVFRSYLIWWNKMWCLSPNSSINMSQTCLFLFFTFVSSQTFLHFNFFLFSFLFLFLFWLCRELKDNATLETTRLVRISVFVFVFNHLPCCGYPLFWIPWIGVLLREGLPHSSEGLVDATNGFCIYTVPTSRTNRWWWKWVVLKIC